MAKRGKQKFIDFDSSELIKLKKYFMELDDDKSGKSSG